MVHYIPTVSIGTIAYPIHSGCQSSEKVYLSQTDLEKGSTLKIINITFNFKSD